jgi:hypothetical protein
MNGISLPEMADDFKRINGIGPAIQQRLHQAEIRTFTQLADLTPTEIADLVSDLTGISAERIAEQDWPGQARELIPEPAPAEVLPGATPSGNRQHDSSFTVKLLLNQDNSVRRTQMVDNRSNAEEQWAGWNASRLVAFISQQAALRLPAEPTLPIAPETEPEPVVMKLAEPDSSAPPTTEEPTTVSTALSNSGDTLHIRELQILPADTNSPRHVFHHSLPFSVRLTLDLTELALPGNEPLEYTATIYAKGLSVSPRQTIGEAHNTIKPNDQLTIFVPSSPLAPGTYRMEAAVTLTRSSAESPEQPDLKAHLEGGIIQVY